MDIIVNLLNCLPPQTKVSDHRSLVSFISNLSDLERVAVATLLPRASKSELFLRFGINLSKHNLAVSSEEINLSLELYQKSKTERITTEYHYSSLFMIMKSTRLCNLRCVYCSAWRSGPNQKMKFNVLAKATIGVLVDPHVEAVDFVWHGGEATLLGIEFYQKALWLQDNFNIAGKRIANSIQTNAVQISDEWIEFLHRNKFSVGVSIDGPELIHDSKRRTIRGNSTYDKIRNNIQKMRSAGIKIGILLVADEEIIELGPQKLLSWVSELEVEEVALLNSLPDNLEIRHGGKEYKHFLPYQRYVEFLVTLYSEWIKSDRKVKIREFESLRNNLEGRKSILCVHNGRCMGQFLTIEPNGTVSACDKYVNDEYYEFGTLSTNTFAELVRSSVSLNSHKAHTDSVSSNFEASCLFGKYCRGGCPHDAYVSQHVSGSLGSCCGLAPLIETMLQTE